MGRKVLVVGGGGREHALALRLLESPSVDEVVVAPGNPGTGVAPERLLGKRLSNFSGSPMEAARATHADLVVVGPEGPLCEGIVDQLRHAGIRTFGPTQRAAQLESSKLFTKEFAERHGIRTARHLTVRDPSDAASAVHRFDAPPVVKADGLCAGKGVVVSRTHEEALQTTREMLSGHLFGDAGKTVVLEERLQGAEASILALSDGERLLVLPAAQDHKRIGDGDTGPNTGGMGAYTPAPLIHRDLADRIRLELLEPAVKGMADEGMPFRGTLYAGVMITPAGDPFLIEFNVRFGDPETQALMNVIKGDLAEALDAASRGALDPGMLGWNGRHAVCVVLAAHGYPAALRPGDRIDGIEQAEALPDVRVYHAGTALENAQLVTHGGRVCGVTASGTTLVEARALAYRAADRIHFSGKQMRRDIARSAIEQT